MTTINKLKTPPLLVNEVAAAMIDFAKDSGWDVSISGFSLTRQYEGSTETFRFVHMNDANHLNITMPKRPYTVEEAGGVPLITNE